MAIMEQVVIKPVAVKIADAFSALESAGIWPKTVVDHKSAHNEDDSTLFLHIVHNMPRVKKFRKLIASNTLRFRHPLSLNSSVYFILESNDEEKKSKIKQALVDFGVVGQIMVTAIQDIKKEDLQQSDIIIVDLGITEETIKSLQSQIETNPQKSIYRCSKKKKKFDYSHILFNIFRRNYVVSEQGRMLIKVGQINMTVDQIKDNIIEALGFVGLFRKDLLVAQKFVGLKTGSSETVALFEIDDDTTADSTSSTMLELHVWRRGLLRAIGNAKKQAKLKAETPAQKEKRLARRTRKKKEMICNVYDAFKKAVKKAANDELKKDTTEKERERKISLEMEAWKIRQKIEQDYVDALNARGLAKWENMSPEELEAAKLEMETPAQRKRRLATEAWKAMIQEKKAKRQEAWDKLSPEEQEAKLVEQELKEEEWDFMSPEEQDAIRVAKRERRQQEKKARSQERKAAKEAAGENAETGSPNLKRKLEAKGNEQASALPKKKKKKKKKKIMTRSRTRNKEMARREQQDETNAGSPNLKRKLEDAVLPNEQVVVPMKILKPALETPEHLQEQHKVPLKKKTKNAKTLGENLNNVASPKPTQTLVNGSAPKSQNIGSQQPKKLKRRKSKDSAQSLSSSDVNPTPTLVNGSTPEGKDVGSPKPKSEKLKNFNENALSSNDMLTKLLNSAKKCVFSPKKVSKVIALKSPGIQMKKRNRKSLKEVGTLNST